MSETLSQARPEFNATQEIVDSEGARQFLDGLVSDSMSTSSEGLRDGLSVKPATEMGHPGNEDRYGHGDRVSLQTSSGVTMYIENGMVWARAPKTGDILSGNTDQEEMSAVEEAKVVQGLLIGSKVKYGETVLGKLVSPEEARKIKTANNLAKLMSSQR